LLAAACFLLALVGWGFYHMRAAHVAQRATERLQEKIDAMRAAEARLGKLRQQTAALDAQSGPLIDAITDRSFWVELIEDLNTRLPKEDIWITELIPTSGGKPVGLDERRMNELTASPTPTPAAAAAGPRRGPTPARPT